MNEGSNATVSEAKSSAEPPRRMKRKASVMWSRNSSSCDDVNDEAEGTEGCKFRRGIRHEGRNLIRGYFSCGETYNTQDLGLKGLSGMVTSS